MFRHVVALKWNADTAADQRAAVVPALQALRGLIPEIRSYWVGEDAGVNEGNHDLVVVADFDSVADYVVYRDHAEHQRVIREYIAPILMARAAVQSAG